MYQEQYIQTENKSKIEREVDRLANQRKIQRIRSDAENRLPELFAEYEILRKERGCNINDPVLEIRRALIEISRLGRDLTFQLCDVAMIVAEYQGIVNQMEEVFGVIQGFFDVGQDFDRADFRMLKKKIKTLRRSINLKIKSMTVMMKFFGVFTGDLVGMTKTLTKSLKCTVGKISSSVRGTKSKKQMTEFCTETEKEREAWRNKTRNASADSLDNEEGKSDSSSNSSGNPGLPE